MDVRKNGRYLDVTKAEGLELNLANVQKTKRVRQYVASAAVSLLAGLFTESCATEDVGHRVVGLVAGILVHHLAGPGHLAVR